MTTAGVVEIVHSFPRAATLADGEIAYGAPRGGVVQANDGHLYAIGSGGEHNNDGSLLRVTLAGDFTPMASFQTAVTGRFPRSPPTVGPDGALYGTAAIGGTGALPLGTIYRLSGNGIFSIVHQFNGGTIGALGSPNGSLLLADDGNLYGWANGVFRLTPEGTVSRVTDAAGFQTGPGMGHGVIQGSDGRLYGVTEGANGIQGHYGAVYSVATSAVGSPPPSTPSDPAPSDPAPADPVSQAGAAVDGGGSSGDLGLAMLLLMLLAVVARSQSFINGQLRR